MTRGKQSFFIDMNVMLTGVSSGSLKDIIVHHFPKKGGELSLSGLTPSPGTNVSPTDRRHPYESMIFHIFPT